MITENLKKRFCKDCNIPIKVFKEPYFTERLILFDKYFDTVNKWTLFTQEFKKGNYKCEQDYYEEYNRVKDDAINDIKSSDGFAQFNSEDMNNFCVKDEYKDLPKKDIFHPSNTGRKFISIDMKKANFSSLRYYDPDIFDGAKSWESFIRRYTDNEHIINSKYIRQVILGNCNPKRHITYEKYLMSTILDELLTYINKERIVFFSNDEIILDVNDIPDDNTRVLLYQIERIGENSLFPIEVEQFTLGKLMYTHGYYKIFTNDTIEFKCVDAIMFPFAIREFEHKSVSELDKVFIHEGLLAKFIETPNEIRERLQYDEIQSDSNGNC